MKAVGLFFLSLLATSACSRADAQTSIRSSPIGAPIVRMFMSPKIDFTQTGDTVVVPARPGYACMFVGSQTRVIITQAGATTQGTVSEGNDATKSNIFAAQAVPSTSTLSLAFATPWLAQNTTVGSASIVDLATPIVAHITAGWTGGTLKGYETIYCAIFPFPT